MTGKSVHPIDQSKTRQPSKQLGDSVTPQENRSQPVRRWYPTKEHYSERMHYNLKMHPLIQIFHPTGLPNRVAIPRCGILEGPCHKGIPWIHPAWEKP